MPVPSYIAHLDPRPALVVFGLHEGIWFPVIRHELGDERQELLRRYSLLRLAAMNVTDALATMPAEGDAVCLIAEERCEQAARGYTAEHDDQHTQGELLEAALAYLVAGVEADDEEAVEAAGEVYPFTDGWQPRENAIANLVTAASLIAAEIDRLLRKRAKKGGDTPR